jgi:hypothetical protein
MSTTGLLTWQRGPWITKTATLMGLFQCQPKLRQTTKATFSATYQP